MEMSPEITHAVGQFLIVGCLELIATGIEEWQKEQSVPALVERFALPPFRSRLLFGAAYLCVVVVFLGL